MKKTTRTKGTTKTISLTILYFALASWSQADTGMAFLKLGVGARPLGMGGAFTALADESSGLHWNPAGSAQLSRPELSALHSVWIADMSYDVVSMVVPIFDEDGDRSDRWLAENARQSSRGPSGAFGASIMGLAMGSQERRGADRSLQGAFGASSWAALISMSRIIETNFSLGANLQFFSENIDDVSALGVAVDVGALWKDLASGLSLGLAVKHLGPSVQFLQESIQLPLTVAFGIGFSGLAPWNLALDIQSQPLDGRTTLSIGSEIVPISPLALRVGYTALAAGATSGGLLRGGVNPISFDTFAGFGGGLGLTLGQITVDYALTPQGMLGLAHRVGIKTIF